MKANGISGVGLEDVKKEYVGLLNKLNFECKNICDAKLRIFSYLELVLLEIHLFFVKKPNVAICRNCGELFVGENGNKIYCPYPYKDNVKCEDIGKNETKKKKREDFPGLKVYDRIYDKKYKRINAAKDIPELNKQRLDEFNEWCSFADERRKKYLKHQISEDEFVKDIIEKSETYKKI